MTESTHVLTELEINMKIFAITLKDDEYNLHVYEENKEWGPFNNISSDIVYSSLLIVGEDGRVFKNRKGNTGTPIDTSKIRQLAEALENVLGE